MKKNIILLTLFVVLVLNMPKIYSQHTLTITIKGLKNNIGHVHLEFSNAKGEKISGFTQSIVNNQSVIVINNIKSGNYTFKYFHDENKNKRLDTNFIGMPKEGFGFSNNAKGMFGPPDLEKTIINVRNNTFQTCNIIYL